MTHTGAVFDWLQANHGWLGYVVMSFLGGSTAHIMALEKSVAEWQWSRHLNSLFTSLVKSAFVALIVYFLAQEYAGWPPPLCFVVAGIGSVFASEFIRWLYEKGKSFLEARLPKSNGNG